MSDVAELMFHPVLQAAPRHTLPTGYELRPYRDEADIDDWLTLHRRIGPDEPFWVRKTFDDSLGTDQARLRERVLFLHAPNGDRIGSITAWNDADFNGVDSGRIHWVVLDPSVHGRGLSKPLLSAACQQLLALGYPNAYLWTSVDFVPAVNLYLQFGFRPAVRDTAEFDAWHAARDRFKTRYSLPARESLPVRAQ
jgi:GNAT superfamily N-acetyltransferase